MNTPEGDPESFGPYNINRVIYGLEGNAKVLMNKDDDLEFYLRKGILIHTGEWKDWNETQPMPNSLGCIHLHPNDCDHLQSNLISLGVEVRKNLLSNYLPYPWVIQGLLSIEQIGAEIEEPGRWRGGHSLCRQTGRIKHHTLGPCNGC